jgi:DMSO/TMAO reductase YedYZ molybdopterin-dependent catalytic subunit
MSANSLLSHTASKATDCSLRRGVTALVRRFFVYGLVGGVVATPLMYIGTIVLGLPFPPEAIHQLLVAPVPGSIESVIVETLRELAKYLVFVFALAAYLMLYGFTGALVGFIRVRVAAGHSVAVIVGIAVPTLVGLGLQADLAASTSNASSALGWLTAVILGIGVNVLYVGVFLCQARADFLGNETFGGMKNALSSPSRRRFLTLGIIAIVLVGIVTWFSSALLAERSASPKYTPIPISNNPVDSADVASLPNIFQDARIRDLVQSEVSDNSVFFRVDIDIIPPRLYSGLWSLNVFGKVRNSLIIDEHDLLQLPATDEYATLECVSNTINIPGGLISNAKWTGVSLATVLARAGPTSDAEFVVLRCADGYSVGIPIHQALLPGVLLAYRMNDEPLPNEHGFPLRAIVPSKYGMMHAKWVTEIEVLNRIYLGYWQKRGWSNDARIKTTSIICYPRSQAHIAGSVPIAGIAFAGDMGISEVEVSVDGGSTWNRATLKKPRSPYSWVLWAYEWTPTAKGAATIVVRAYDSTGRVQDSVETAPFPDGASGYNYTQVTVT